MAHLTDADLQDLIAGRLDASGRCSTAEHLARCDACLLRYTQMLTPETELTPIRPTSSAGAQSLRTRGARRVLQRYGALAAAVLLAILFWSGGVFSHMVPDAGSNPSVLTSALSWFSDGTASTMDKLTNPLHRINDPIPYINQQGDLHHE